MNHKATLFCDKGRLFRPACHFLLLDNWITESYGQLILSHVILSEQEYQSIKISGEVAIYQSMSFSWVGLYSCHKSRKYSDYQCIGILKRVPGQDRLYRGYVNVK